MTKSTNNHSGSLQEIQDYIDKNELKIAYLQELNDALKDRFDVQSNLKVLATKLHTLETDEREHCERHNGERRAHLTDLEHRGSDLCAEHARVVHQIEHIEWHLGNGHKHPHCAPPAPAPASCKSSATTTTTTTATGVGGGGAGHHLHAMRGGPQNHQHHHHHSQQQLHHKSHETLSLEHTSERLIKSIAELRRRIFAAKEKLEKEIQRKKCVEKSLGELRRDISRQKKIISTRRVTPLPAIPAASAAMSAMPRKPAYVQ